jgi:hypothetical protein
MTDSVRGPRPIRMASHRSTAVSISRRTDGTSDTCSSTAPACRCAARERPPKCGSNGTPGVHAYRVVPIPPASAKNEAGCCAAAARTRADAAEATKFWLSTLPEETPIADLVHLAKQRWLIERDYLELKQELGLGHYEGRGWRGFHHHAALCIAAYGFLVAERAAFPPSGTRSGRLVKAAAVPGRQQPRGSPTASRAARAALDRDAAKTHRTRACSAAATMSVLPSINATAKARSIPFVTQ